MKTLTNLSILTLTLALCALSGCATVVPLHQQDSDDKSTWVVQGGELYRCTDGAAEGKPPRPVCVRAPMVEP